MMKFIKTVAKVIGAIVGAYAVFNTLVWAKVGASRALKYTLDNWDDIKDLSMVEKVWVVDGAVFDESDAEWERFKALRSTK